MQTITVDPQYLVDIMMGTKQNEVRTESTDYRGKLLIASNGIRQKQLPVRMAGAIVELEDVVDAGDGKFDWQFKLINLVRPFRVMGQDQMFEVADDNIINEPVNWFDTQSENEAHTKVDQWATAYLAEHPDIERIPRQDIPDAIVEIAISFDHWRLAYFNFIDQPSKQQKLAFKKVRYDVDPA